MQSKVLPINFTPQSTWPAGLSVAIILQMRERMEEMNRQMQGFVDYVRSEMFNRMQGVPQGAAIVPLRRPVVTPPSGKQKH